MSVTPRTRCNHSSSQPQTDKPSPVILLPLSGPIPDSGFFFADTLPYEDPSEATSAEDEDH